MADINYFLELSPECVKFILNQLGYEEVGRAACVCREFYKELSPRAKTIAHTIQCAEKRKQKKCSLTKPGVEPYDSGDIIWFPPGLVNL
eukprot:SAG22_NODE_181_length_16048_cov_157.464418_8_plen_89_part_00